MEQCYESALSAKSLARSIGSGKTTSLAIAISRTVNLALLWRRSMSCLESVPASS
jgi:hypothetical protein